MTSTAPTDTIVDLFTRDLHLEPRHTIRADERRMADDGPDWRLACYHIEAAEDVHADHWERHPSAEEAVCCLRGAIGLCLRAAEPDVPEELVRLLPGQGVIVPRNRWHRFEFEQPTDLLAITVRRGTELEQSTIC